MRRPVTMLYYLRSFLFQFNQNSIAVFRMEEHNGFPVRSNSGLGTQTSDLFTFNVSHCSLDVIDFYTDVMNTTSFILLQIPGNGGLLSQRMQQFQLCI